MAGTGPESMDQSQRLEVIKSIVDHPLPTLDQTTNFEGTTFNQELTKRVGQLTMLGEMLLPTAEALCAEIKLMGTEDLPFDVERFKSLVPSINLTIKAFKYIHNQIGNNMPLSDQNLSQLAYNIGVFDNFTESKRFQSCLQNLAHFAYEFYEVIELSVANLDTEVRKLISTGIGVLSIEGRELNKTSNLESSFEAT